MKAGKKTITTGTLEVASKILKKSATLALLKKSVILTLKTLDKKPALILLPVIFFIAVLSAYWLNNIPIHRLISFNEGHWEPVYKARFCFLVLSGIVIIITQNFFIQRNLKRKQNSQYSPSDEQVQN